MMCSRVFRRLAIWLCLFSILASRLMAQSAGTGAVTGVVTDSSHAVIPGAAVLATNIQTGQTRNATTDGTGAYSLPLLPPAIYSLRFSKQGFQTADVADVRVN